MTELEIIHNPQIPGLSLFFDTLEYRTPHFHPEWELVCPFNHPLLVRVEAHEHVVAPGEILFLSPRQLHEYHRIDAPSTFLCMQVSSSLFPSLRGISTDAMYPHRHMSPEAFSCLRDRLLDMIHAYLLQEPQYELYCIGQAGLVLHTLFCALPSHRLTDEEAAQVARKNERLERFLQYVDTHFRERILLRDFARAEGLSMHYVSGFIRQTLNQSFQEYVSTVRFNYACERMVVSDDKLLSICMDAGFSDYRYFSAAFRQRTGMTPEAYRDVLLRGEQVVGTAGMIRHSMHSREQFYTREESLRLWQEYHAKSF